MHGRIQLLTALAAKVLESLRHRQENVSQGNDNVASIVCTKN